jgi:dTDP-4-dehydrorhamnose 3,5-epimerase
MEIKQSDLDGVWITKSTVHSDNRGVFRECSKFLESHDKTLKRFEVAQTNFSISKKGVIRGIHYSLDPNEQWKWVVCLKGSIMDVVVDLRKTSPTFLRVESFELTGENGLGILIQGNFGHAFQATSDEAYVVYNLSSEYNPALEKEINPNDQTLAINWPLKSAILSEKDRNSPSLLEIQARNLLPEQRIDS